MNEPTPRIPTEISSRVSRSIVCRISLHRSKALRHRLATAAVFPPSSVLAVVAFAAVAAVAYRAPSELATMLLIRGSYLFLAVLVAAVWFEPLSG